MSEPAKPNPFILIALGSNLASRDYNPAENLRKAIKLLAAQGLVIRALSPFYSTPAFPVGSGPDFVNACAAFEAVGSPQDVIEILHGVEAEMGRVRSKRWGQRTIDLDLLAFGDLVLPDAQIHAKWRNLPLEAQMSETPDRLILPHPRVQERAFVLVPLADIAPDWRHPLLNKTVKEMCDALPQRDIAQVRLAD